MILKNELSIQLRVITLNFLEMVLNRFVVLVSLFDHILTDNFTLAE